MSLEQVYPVPHLDSDEYGSASIEKLDFVAILTEPKLRHGLAGSKPKQDNFSLWIQDWLADEFPHCRILVHNPQRAECIEIPVTEQGLPSPVARLLNLLLKFRESDPYRPIVFMAKRTEYLTLMLVIVLASKNPLYRSIWDATRAILLINSHGRAPFSAALKNTLEYVAPLSIAQPDAQHLRKGFFPQRLLVRDFFRALHSGLGTRFRISFLGEIGPPISLGRLNSILEPGEATGTRSKYTHAIEDVEESRQEVRDELERLLRWAFTIDPERSNMTRNDFDTLISLRTRNIASREPFISEPTEGSLTWFWDHPAYLSWSRSDDHRPLWISGIPGAGKSVLANHIVSTFSRRGRGNAPSHLPSWMPNDGVPTARIFFDARSPIKYASSILQYMLHQIVSNDVALLKYVEPRYRRASRSSQNEDGRVRSLARLVLHLARHKRVFIMIDALDECSSDVQEHLINTLNIWGRGVTSRLRGETTKSHGESRSVLDHCIDNSTCLESASQLKFCVSSRTGRFSNTPCFSLATHIDLSKGKAAAGIYQDIGIYVTNHLEWAQNEQYLCDEIIRKSEGIFLWVRLCVSELNRWGRTITDASDLFQRVRELPMDLDDLFTTCLDQLNSDSETQSMALLCLGLVASAKRPLSVAELNAGLSLVQLGGNMSSLRRRTSEHFQTPFLPVSLSFDTEYETFWGVWDLCSPLLEVHEPTTTVNFIHQSVHDSLRGDMLKRLTCDSEMFWACRTSFDSERLPQRDANSLRTTKLRLEFRDYASIYWHDHFLTAQTSQKYAHISLDHALTNPRSRIFRRWFPRWLEDRDASGLTPWVSTLQIDEGAVLALLGNVQEFSMLMGQDSVPLKYDESGRAARRRDGSLRWALASAACSDLPEMVNIAILHSAWEPSQSETKAVLKCAMDQEEDTILQMLLRRPFRTENARAKQAQTALELATEYGNADLVRVLLENGADVNGRGTKEFLTPLHTAGAKGHLEVVETLLKSGARVTVPSRWTSLLNGFWSASAVKKMVEAAYLDPEEKDSTGATLAHALAQDGRPDTFDPLGGSVRFVKVLNPDLFGMTPLQYAARSGWLFGIRSLLWCSSDDLIQHGFLTACEACSIGAVELFLIAGANVNIKRDGSQALHRVFKDRARLGWAAKCSLSPSEEDRVDLIRLLIAYGANVLATDDNGNTGLHLASRTLRESCAKALLGSGADPSCLNQKDETPFSIAAGCGAFRLVKLFLDQGAVVSHVVWRSGLSSGKRDVVELLLGSSSQIGALSELSPNPSEVLTYFFAGLYVPSRFKRAINYLRTEAILDFHYILISGEATLSLIDKFKNWWERVTGRPGSWVWRPFTSPRTALENGQVSLRWNCIPCAGKDHEKPIPGELGWEIVDLMRFLSSLPDHVSEASAQAHTLKFSATNITPDRPLRIEELKTIILKRCYTPAADPGSESDHIPTNQSDGFEMGSLNEAPSTSDTLSSNTIDCVGTFSGKSMDDSSTVSLEVGAGEESEDPEAGNDRRELFVLVKPVSFPLVQIPVLGMTDLKFFNMLQYEYKLRRHSSWLRFCFSLWRFHHFAFDQYEQSVLALESRSDGSKRHNYLPEPGNPDYVFLSVQDATPVPQRIFYGHCYSCKAHCALRALPNLFHECRGVFSLWPDLDVEACADTQYLSRIPKRYEKWDPRPQDFEESWGLTAFENPSFLGFMSYSFAAFIGCLAFGAWWLKDHSDDMQNAWVPVGLFFVIWVFLYQMVRGVTWNSDVEY